MDLDISHVPARPQLSLAEELGVSEDGDSPLRDKAPPPPSLPAQAIAPNKPAAPVRRGATEKGKGKARAEPAPSQPQAPQTRTSRARAGATLEKENVKRAKLNPPSTGAAAAGGSRDAKKPPLSKPASGIGARTRSGGGAGAGGGARGTVVKPPSRGGPRRVPIGSAEATPVPSWRG